MDENVSENNTDTDGETGIYNFTDSNDTDTFYKIYDYKFYNLN